MLRPLFAPRRLVFSNTLVAALAFATVAAPARAAADQVVTGPSTGPANCFPIACSAGLVGSLNYYQFVVQGALFGSSPVDVSALTFFVHPTFAALTNRQIAQTPFQITFGQTAVTPATLSATAALNPATLVETFYTGTLPGAGTAVSVGPVTIVGLPYRFNPGAGNLLVTLTSASYAMTGLGTAFETTAAGTSCARAVSTTSPTGTTSSFVDANCTRAGFTFAAAPTSTVPEPGTVLLLGTGLLGLMAAGRSRLAATQTRD